MFQTKHFPILLVIIAVLASSLQVFAADAFPITINGRTINLSLETTRESAEMDLSAVFPDDKQSVLNDDRIQYDFIAVEGQSPLTLTLDFTGGKLAAAAFDAYAREGNPVAQELVKWLKANVGEGENVNGNLVWAFAGMSFEFVDMPEAGEDSMFSVTMRKSGM